MDYAEIEEKIKAKTASIPEFFEYFHFVVDADDCKFAQASCCFIDYCLNNGAIDEMRAYNDKYHHQCILLKFRTSTEKAMHQNADLEFPMEAVANDFETYYNKMNIALISSNNNNKEDNKSVGDDSISVSNQIIRIFDNFGSDYTTFGRILLVLYIIFSVTIAFVGWEFTPLIILAGLRLFTTTNRTLNKISVWLLAFGAPFILPSAIPDIWNNNLCVLLLFAAPIVSILLAMIKGFSLNKYLFWNILSINIVLFASSFPPFIVSVCISILLIIQLFLTEKWENTLVFLDFCADDMAAIADNVNRERLFHRLTTLYNEAQKMKQEDKDSLIYIPSIFVKEPEKESVGGNNSIFGSIILLLAVIISAIVIFNCFSIRINKNVSNETNNSVNNSVKETEITPSQSFSIYDQEDYPFTAQRKISLSELSSYSKDQLSIMRNEIYARHGYIFKRNDLKEYFSKKTWYNPRYSSVDKYLTKIEKVNVQTILKAEKAR